MTSVPGGETKKQKAEPFKVHKVVLLVKVKMIEGRAAPRGDGVQSCADGFIQIGVLIDGWQETHFTCAKIGQ